VWIVTFAIAFLGSMFAIALSVILVYTYIVHLAIPRIMRGLSALFERANLDPDEAMRQLGVSPAKAAVPAVGAVPPPSRDAVRVIFTCEDHGRCVGCPKVLAQFEAIVRHQGAESFDEVERRCYDQLRDQFVADAPIVGEGEADRQRRIAGRVVETLVREGFRPPIARGVVWACGKDDRTTFASWLAAARAGCEQLTPKDEESAA
jgi:hypothetical protein